MEEIHKTEQKIADLQQYLKGLHAALKQEEDNEMIKSIRGMKLDSHALHDLLNGIQDFLQILIGTLACLFPYIIYFLFENKIIYFPCSLKHQYITEPELEKIQVISNVLLVIGKLLNGFCKLIDLHVICILQNTKGILGHVCKFLGSSSFLRLANASMGVGRINFSLIIRYMKMLHKVFLHKTVIYYLQVKTHAS